MLTSAIQEGTAYTVGVAMPTLTNAAIPVA
jgi:hypothetical protein